MQFDPKPGRAYTDEEPAYISPDVYIHKVGDKYFVVANDDGLPKLKISDFYRAALQGGPKAKEYIQERLRSAQWLIRSIQQRQRTIVRVTESILRFQREFFDKGAGLPEAADPARRGRGHRHARVDGVPGDHQQVRAHARRASSS